ncbi:MAG: prephenate dehydratase [Pirellulales bacterium]|nr:prephenate dehydratase [Pirellulales bacterium]
MATKEKEGDDTPSVADPQSQATNLSEKLTPKAPPPASGAREVGFGIGDKSLAELRSEIDQIDSQLVELINRRAELAQHIGRLKMADGQPAYVPIREDEVLELAVSRSQGPLSKASIQAVFREIISGTRAAEKNYSLAYLGPEYSYSHLAAIHRFGQSVEMIAVNTIPAVFEEVERGHVNFGLVPIENTTDGRIADTLDAFSRSHVRLCGEVPLRIHHCLLGKFKRDAIRLVYSKPQALSQCRNWLAQHLPASQTIEVASTSEAARLASEEPGSAAVASEQAGINYHLRVLARNIEDNPENITRFVVISDRPAERSGNDKTSIFFSIAHTSGSLASALDIFSQHGLNLTWIESFPIPGSRGQYLFFVEFEGHQADTEVQEALGALTQKAARLEVLGSYPQMEPVG